MSSLEFNTEAERPQGVHLTLHLINGRRLVFEQIDPHKAEVLLEHLRPERIFSQKNLLIANHASVTVIPSRDVERIDLRSPLVKSWHGGSLTRATQEVDVEQYARLLSRPYTPPNPDARRPDPPREIGICVELRSGEQLTLISHPLPGDAVGAGRDPMLTPDDAAVFLQHLSERPVVIGALQDGHGVFLLNPLNAMRFEISPPPPVHLLATVWSMEPVEPVLIK
ncbi:MAG: hypothetical protein QM758_11505 [Armatimonas sp.]